MQRIEYPKGSKVTIEDGVILIEPAKWEPKVGEIVRVYVGDGESYMIALYKRSDELIITSGLGTDYTLHLNDGRWEGIHIYPQYKVTPASEDDKIRLLTALSEAGYQYNEETHEVEKIRWRPKDGEDYFSFTAVGIYQSKNIGTPDNIDIINNGFAFKTETEAQEFFDKIKQLANENR